MAQGAGLNEQGNSEMRAKGYGQDEGIGKVRLHEEDRTPRITMVNVTVLKKRSKDRLNNAVGQMKYSWKPRAQATYRATIKKKVTEFVGIDCTSSERKIFVRKACQVKNYTNNDATYSC